MVAVRHVGADPDEALGVGGPLEGLHHVRAGLEVEVILRLRQELELEAAGLGQVGVHLFVAHVGAAQAGSAPHEERGQECGERRPWFPHAKYLMVSRCGVRADRATPPSTTGVEGGVDKFY